jgi:hypothetical protein
VRKLGRVRGRAICSGIFCAPHALFCLQMDLRTQQAPRAAAVTRSCKSSGQLASVRKSCGEQLDAGALLLQEAGTHAGPS